MGDSAKEVLTAILQRKSKDDQEAALQNAQVDLVNRVGKTCWTTEGLKNLLWVQTYVEPERRLEKVLRGMGDSIDIQSLFLHRAADISAPSGTARHFYEDVLIPKLDALPKSSHKDVWLSNRLADRNCPPVVRFWMNAKKVECDWSALTVDKLYCVIFGDGREMGEYLHVAYPCRTTDLSEHVGPAGIYLLLQDRQSNSKIPPCLIFHLRAFVQSLVTAQLWAVAQHLLERERLLSEKLRAKSRPFATHHGHFRMFLQAAQGIREIIDPLAIDTAALDIAQLLANDIFDVRGMDGTRLYHRYSAVQPPTNTSALAKLLKDYFDAIAMKTKDLGNLAAITTAIGEMAKDADVAELWCLAHACYKGTVSLAVLTGNKDDIGLELTPAAEPRDDQVEEAAQHLLYAATQLAIWKVNGVQFYFDKAASTLSITSNEAIGNWEKLKVDIYDWCQGTRWKINEGGDTAEPWARILRGCAGPVENIGEWLNKITITSEQAVVIPVFPNDVRTL